MISYPILSPLPPARWAWHYQKLQDLLQRLLDRCGDHTTEAFASTDSHSMDSADSAADEWDHDLALGLLSQEEDASHEVVSAILRILDGTYGICEDTGRPIPAARLRAIPWARRTREAQERVELAGAHSGGRFDRIFSWQGSSPDGWREDAVAEADEEPFPARRQRESDVRAIIEGAAQV